MKKTPIYIGYFLFLLFAAGGGLYAQKISASSPLQKWTFTPSVPHPELPARLVVENIRFSDADTNGMLNAGEVCKVMFDIVNTGKGEAYRVQPVVSVRGAEGSFSGISIANVPARALLAPGERMDAVVLASATTDIETAKIFFDIRVEEGNGFNADPGLIAVATRAFEPPRVVVADYRFSNEKGSAPHKNEVITLQIVIQNQGMSAAKDVTLDLDFPEFVFAGGEKNYRFDSLEVGSSRLIELPFFTNSRFDSPTLQIKASLGEKYGRYAQGRTLSVNMEKSLSRTVAVEIRGSERTVEGVTPASLHADVDVNIPHYQGASQNHVFALVIGNERYGREQDGARNIDVPFAHNDAAVFRQYLVQALGIPAANVRFLTDVSKVTLQSEAERLCNVARTYTGKEKPEVIFYYAGHGMYDDQKNACLIPVDVPGTKASLGIRLDDLYRMTGDGSLGRATFFIDACFSGGARDGVLLAARGIRVEANKDRIDGNVVVFSASQGSESAFAYPEQQHGMFTYFLLKKWQQSGGGASYGEIADYLRSEVSHHAFRVNNAPQTPQVLTGYGLEGQWEGWKFK